MRRAVAWTAGLPVIDIPAAAEAKPTEPKEKP
jgi:hypothetical protein